MECFVTIPEKLPIGLAVGRNWCHPNLVMEKFPCFVDLLPKKRQVHACILKHSFSGLFFITMAVQDCGRKRNIKKR